MQVAYYAFISLLILYLLLLILIIINIIRQRKSLSNIFNNVNELREGYSSLQANIKENRKLIESKYNDIYHKIEQIVSQLAEPNSKIKINEFLETLNNIKSELLSEKNQNNKIINLITDEVKCIYNRIDKLEDSIKMKLKEKIFIEEKTQQNKENESDYKYDEIKNLNEIVEDKVSYENKDVIIETKKVTLKQELLNLLENHKSENYINEIINEIYSTEKISNSILKKLILLYKYCYKTELESLSNKLENFLSSNFDIKFYHAKIDFNKNSAIGFEIIKKEEIFKLKDDDKKKIHNKIIPNNKSGNTILFEFYPQVIMNNEMILKGKVLVS